MGISKSGRDIVVIGGSAGAWTPLQELCSLLPPDLMASVFVVIHAVDHSAGILPQTIQQNCRLPAVQAVDGMPIEMGKIYLAPHDRHLILSAESLHAVQGPKENQFRPAIDPLFRSAARAFGPRVTAVVLSGGMNDGTYGAMVVKACGGIVLAQNPEEALSPGMPLSVIKHVPVDHVLGITGLARMIEQLASKALTSTTKPPAMTIDPLPGELKESRTPEGTLVPLICPECGGPLWRQVEGDFVRFRCHTGHAMTADSLLQGQFDVVESALWSAVRVLDEQVILLHDMAYRAGERSLMRSAETYTERATEAKQRAHVLRQLLLRPSSSI